MAKVLSDVNMLEKFMSERKSEAPRLASPALATHDAGSTMTRVLLLLIVFHAKVVSHFVCQGEGRDAHVLLWFVLHHARGQCDAVGRSKAM